MLFSSPSWRLRMAFTGGNWHVGAVDHMTAIRLVLTCVCGLARHRPFRGSAHSRQLDGRLRPPRVRSDGYGRRPRKKRACGVVPPQAPQSRGIGRAFLWWCPVHIVYHGLLAPAQPVSRARPQPRQSTRPHSGYEKSSARPFGGRGLPACDPVACGIDSRLACGSHPLAGAGRAPSP